jgi:deoxycytidylate deaminase
MKGPGRCAKVTTTCLIVLPDGGPIFMGQNMCDSPQEECPRGNMPTGTGYDLCDSVCKQRGHAEKMAIKAAGNYGSLSGATLYLHGHYYICDDCQEAIDKAGIKKIVIQEEEY